MTITNTPVPVGAPTAAHVAETVAVTAAALRAVSHEDWKRPAAGLEWSCHDTAEHLASDYAAYAGQLTGRARDGYVPFEVTAEPDTDPEGLIRNLEATGGLLEAVVAHTDPTVRAWHPYGFAGPDGFAAMGIVEALLHTYDIHLALTGTTWRPPAHLPALALDRLFPHRPADAEAAADPWAALLRATGRGADPAVTPGPQTWRWYSDPIRGERVLLCEAAPKIAADLAQGGAGGFVWAEEGPGEGTRRAAGMLVAAAEKELWQPGWGLYVVVRAEDRTAVGGVGFHGSPDPEGVVEIGYDLLPTARGAGLATDAVRALTAWTLARPGLRAVTARVDADNAPSRAVLLRADYARDESGDAPDGTLGFRRTADTAAHPAG
ncbi:GNAT family N-acetyltransferase [Streptomyces sp. BI20]|uniref:GNAT family N-acetyltransferase n=1 Tax=Streptomyces sp. BI20 TaxID=3403460 RepID=UPI003C74374C